MQLVFLSFLFFSFLKIYGNTPRYLAQLGFKASEKKVQQYFKMIKGLSRKKLAVPLIGVFELF